MYHLADSQRQQDEKRGPQCVEGKVAAAPGQHDTRSQAQRGAQFVSVIAFADPSGEIRFTAEGICRGSITDGPRGSNGFGYDPIFQPDGYERTFGEMSDDEKRSLSHRGKASIEFIRKMSDFTGV